MKHDLTEDELRAAMAKELGRQGIRFTTTRGVGRGLLTEEHVLSALADCVSDKMRPVTLAEVSQWARMKRQTVKSAIDRLISKGEVIGNAELGFVAKSGRKVADTMEWGVQ